MAQRARYSAKGWARDNILSVLLARPASLSLIASTVGISKSTASYHMKELVKRGLAEITDVRRVRGGVYSKTFAITRGAVVISRPSSGTTGSEAQLTEEYGRLKLEWTRSAKPEGLIVFLYNVFLSLAGSPVAELDRKFAKYGTLFGAEIVASEIRDSRVGELAGIAAWLGRNGIAICTVRPKGRGTHLMTFASFVGASDPDNPVFAFMEGTVGGALASRHGSRYAVERVEEDSGFGELLIARRKIPGPERRS